MAVTVDTKSVREVAKNLKKVEPITKKAFLSALNRTTQMTRTEASKNVRKTYRIKAQDVNKTVTVKRGSVSNLTSELKWSGANIPLIKFRASPNKVTSRRPRVLKAAVKRAGLKPIRGAFIAKAGSHIGVFERTGKKRLPIEELFGPSTPSMLGQEEQIDHLQQFAEEKLTQRFEHELNHRLEKAGFE